MTLAAPLRPLALLLALIVASCAPQRPAEAGEWNNLFERKEGFGWSGGDAATSIPLPGNRTLWLFGDSYLSGIADGRRDRVEMRFGNTVAIQKNVAPGTPPTPADVRFDWGPPDSNGWLPIDPELLKDPAAPPSAARAAEQHLPVLSWPLHGMVIGNDLVLFSMPVTESECEPCGLFPFKVHGTTITVIRGVNRPYEEWGFRSGAGWDTAHKPRPRFVPHSRGAEALDDATGLLWGTFLMRDAKDPEVVYIYGHRDAKTERVLVVARVMGVKRADDLLDFGRWMFWDGRGFTRDPDRAAAIAGDSEVEASVVPVPSSEGGGFALVQSGNLFSGEIRVAIGKVPWGPFVDRYRLSLADCPVGGYDPKVRQLTYAAKAHPELSTDDELLVSLVTMPLAEDKLPAMVPDPRQYAPRFTYLPWSEITSYAHSSAERCDSRPRGAAAP
jgi:hypothetical protein